MARKVPAVHGRDVARSQRRQGLGVVPVVEVAAMAFECLHRMQRVGGSFDELAARDVAEVTRRHIGEERQPHCGGRRAMSYDRDRVLLKVVWRQPMIVGTDKGFEESPGPACGLPQKKYLVT